MSMEEIPKYPKMANLWKRNMDLPGEAKGVIMPGTYSELEFSNIKRWHVTEKIHGTNIRVAYTVKMVPSVMSDFPGEEPGEICTATLDPQVAFFGRKSGEKFIYPPLLEYLKRTFTAEALDAVFPGPVRVVLYGEGYGHKVQNWHYGREDQSFMLFDILIGHTWLSQDSVAKIAYELGVDTVPWLGLMTQDEIVEMCERGFTSSVVPNHPGEGLVARSEPLMLFRFNPRPVQFKLKCGDYSKLRKVTE